MVALKANNFKYQHMQQIEPLNYGKFYHIYNRGVNGCDLFVEPTNYEHFLNLYDKYISPVADTYAWVLMKNHFHLLVRVKEESEIGFLSDAKPSEDSIPDGGLDKGKYVQDYPPTETLSGSGNTKSPHETLSGSETTEGVGLSLKKIQSGSSVFPFI